MYHCSDHGFPFALPRTDDYKRSNAVSFDQLDVIEADQKRTDCRRLTYNDRIFFEDGNYTQGYFLLIDDGMSFVRSKDYIKVVA